MPCFPCSQKLLVVKMVLILNDPLTIGAFVCLGAGVDCICPDEDCPAQAGQISEGPCRFAGLWHAP